MRTAITFNERHHLHALPGHVERPERLQAIRKLLEADGILNHTTVLPTARASVDDVLLVHTPDYYDRLEAAVAAGGTRLDPDTYAGPDSLEIALEALGGVLAVTRAVLEGSVNNGYAIVRPPGHHARPNEAMGFCLLANVAIAAEWAKKWPNVEKILIVDFDVHHGNGTQEVFYDDPAVMYMSVHQWPLYPGTGALDETGTERARGTTVNIPLPSQTGDEAYARVFREILTPIALAFDPDLVFVSAGYDAHWMDLIGGMNISVAGFAEIIREILTWAERCTDHRLVAVLEGGYNTDALAHCVLTTLRLMGDAASRPSDPFGKPTRPDRDISDFLDRLIELHKLK